MLDLPADHVEARVALTFERLAPQVGIVGVGVHRVKVTREKAATDSVENLILVFGHVTTLYPTGQ